jgi:hypothetical protein
MIRTIIALLLMSGTALAQIKPIIGPQPGPIIGQIGPAVTVDDSVSIQQGWVVAVPDISVSDQNASTTVSVELTDNNGLLAATASGNATVTGSASSDLIIAGTFGDVNATLATLTDTDADAADAPDAMLVTATDNLNATAQSSETVNVIADPANYVVEPDLATASARSAAQCQALGCDGVQTVYWWPIVALSDGTFALVIQPSGPQAATATIASKQTGHATPPQGLSFSDPTLQPVTGIAAVLGVAAPQQ